MNILSITDMLLVAVATSILCVMLSNEYKNYKNNQ